MRAEAVVFLGVFCAIGIAGTLLHRRRSEFRSMRASLLGTVQGAAPLIVLLIGFNGVLLGQYTLSTAAGYNATSTVYNLFDRVEPRDELFGRIMTKYYRGPSRIDFSNDAWAELYAHAPEMPMKRRGPLSLNADLCAYAGAVSHRLQRRFPGVVLANAVRSFGRTFIFNHGGGITKARVTDPQSPSGDPVLESQLGHDVAEPFRRVQSLAMLLCYCLTLLALPVAAIALRRKSAAAQPKLLVLLQVASGTVATLIAYGFAHTYFPHYGMCFFGCIVICAAILSDELIQQWLVRKGRAQRAV
jgi:hypothetical protein